MAITFGKVPHPAFLDNLIPDAQTRCFDNLGQRTIKGVVYHRQLGGTSAGTENYFRAVPPGGFDFCPEDPNDPTYFNWGGCRGLTDYAVAHNSVDQIDGEIRRWNDPTGEGHPGVSPNRAAWASGSVSEPYGDGLAFLNDHGGDENVVNRDQASIEISGFYGDPISNACKDSVAALSAYFADQAHIPWNDYPNIPGENYSFARWHQEFTIGTGKICPGKTVMDQTNNIIDRTVKILRSFQEPRRLIRFGAVRRFHTLQGATARRSPSRSSGAMRNFEQGELIESDGFFNGQLVAGDDRWVRMHDDRRWVIHSSGLQEEL